MPRGRSRREERAMELVRDAVLLRVFLGEDKMHGDKPLYEAIALKARESRMAGATVIHGILGFGHSTRLHTARVLMSEDLPVIVEIIDTEEKIDAFLKLLDGVPDIGLVTLDKVKTLGRRPAGAGAQKG